MIGGFRRSGTRLRALVACGSVFDETDIDVYPYSVTIDESFFGVRLDVMLNHDADLPYIPEAVLFEDQHDWLMKHPQGTIRIMAIKFESSFRSRVYHWEFEVLFTEESDAIAFKIYCDDEGRYR